ncbi:hypothetical protein CDAR_528681 [Caerostris darwini]|uniref:Uncharacterized protein n=1 Tax=Caerostris darwini TaxID=1538125 RepID=A0AAV4UPY3_9ARAC|nr:hypothetical protein CDAR_528681 [Caerostris darwini]
MNFMILTEVTVTTGCKLILTWINNLNTGLREDVGSVSTDGMSSFEKILDLMVIMAMSFIDSCTSGFQHSRYAILVPNGEQMTKVQTGIALPASITPFLFLFVVVVILT